MAQPLFIGPYDVGAQKNLKPFMLPDQAFPNLLNAFVYRGRVERKFGYSLLGRLKRDFTTVSIGNSSVSPWSFNIFTALSITAQPQANIVPGSVTITITGPITFKDNGLGVFQQYGVITGATQANPCEITSNNHSLVTGSVITISGVGGMTQLNGNTYTITSTGVNTFTLDGVDSTAFTAYTTGGSWLSTNATNFGTINYSTGAVVLTHTAGAGVATTITLSYNPTLPVMGLQRRELVPLNTFQTVAFDTKYAYRFIADEWSELPSTMPTTWNGQDYQLFWTTNYAKDASGNDLFWASNDNPGLNGYAITLLAGAAGGPPSTVNITTSTANNFQIGDNVLILNPSGNVPNGTTGTVTVAGNPFTISNPGTGVFSNGATTGIVLNLSRQVSGVDTIKYYNGTTWSIFNPTTLSGIVPNIILGALLMVPYKGRLVLLNTTEGTSVISQNFQNRARWSQNGSPIDLVNGWLDDTVGRGGFTDAPTLEAIISCGFVKDTLVVYFERSTWQLVYTSNELLPFIWQRIDSELGAESTFSNVQFDNALLAFGNVGIHSCNGVKCERIDAIIPDEVFTINNSNNGTERVSAIRDFLTELTYFSYPSPISESPNAATDLKFPNRVIVYNYRNNTYSFFRENFTCYGPFQLITPGFTWEDMVDGTSWAPWSSWATPWNSGFQLSGVPSIAAGNQQGFVVEFNPDNNANSHTLSIYGLAGSVVNSPNHNLQADEFVLIDNCTGSTNLNGEIYKILSITDANNFVIDGTSTGTYTGGGTMKLLSNIQINTKEFAPFWGYGRRYRLRQGEFLFDRTSEGQVTVDVYVDTSENYSVTQVDPSLGINNAVLGTNIVSTAPEPNIPQQYQQQQIWQRMYFYTEGDTFQFEFSLSDAQMKDLDIVESDINLHGMVLHFEPAGEFL